jgi:hypothetical protein
MKHHSTNPFLSPDQGSILIKLFALILCLVIFHLEIKSQEIITAECGYIDGVTGEPDPISQLLPGCSNTMGTDVDFVPTTEDAIKVIDVVINVMQKEYPGNPDNFIDIQSHRDFILDIVNNACNLNVFQTNDYPRYNGSNHPELKHVPDMKIRLNVVQINFIQDNNGWDNVNSVGGDYNYINNPRHNDVALNIFLCEGITVEDPITHIVRLWGLGGIGHTQYIMMNGMYKAYSSANGNIPPWTGTWMIMGELLAHEVGHTLGLSHSWVSCSIPDLLPCPQYQYWCSPDISTPPAPNLPCVNNVMGYSSQKRWMSPYQLGRMHKNLTNRDISRFVRHEKVTGQNLDITSDQIWNVNDWVFGDITVKSGHTLTINSKIYMPLSSKIYVERGARLYLSCAFLTTCREPINSLQVLQDGDYWTGIKVFGRTDSPQFSDMSDLHSNLHIGYAGVVIAEDSKLYNASIAIHIENPTVTWPTYAQYYGGYVKATDTEFKNNKRGLAYMKYDFDNIGAIVGCQFLSSLNNTPYAITMWGLRKMYIFDCDFNDISKIGVLGWDSQFEVGLSRFNDTHHGIESYSSSPLTGQLVSGKNNFTNCDVGEQATNSLKAQSLENTFTSNDVGTAMIGDTRFLTLHNDYENCGNGINLEMTRFNGDNQIRCNTFNDNDEGILALGDNEGARFIFNHFANDHVAGNNVGVDILNGLQNVFTGRIRFAQAWFAQNNPNVLLPAGNLFSSNFDFSHRHIVTEPIGTNINNSDEFEYHHSDVTLQQRVYPYCGINGTCPVGSISKFLYSAHAGGTSEECGRSISGSCSNTICYSQIVSDYNNKKAQYASSPTTNNKILYQTARGLKYATLDTLVRDYIGRKDYSGLDALLQSDSEQFAKRARIGLKILQSDFNGARSLLNQYQNLEPGDQDFKDIQTININRLENRSGLSSQDISTLQGKINSNSIEQGYARAILSHEVDSIFEPVFGQFSITPRTYDLYTENQTKENTLLLVPNPTNGFISVYWPNQVTSNEIKQLDVIGMDGQIVAQIEFISYPVEVDLSNFPIGVYVVRVFDRTNGTFKVSKLLLTK